MVQPNLSDGTTTVNLQSFEPSQSVKPAKIARLPVPGRNGDLVQWLGVDAESLSFSCYSTVAADISQLRTWRNNGTELTYNDDDHTTMRCVIQELTVEQPPSYQTDYRTFTLTLVEVA